MGGFFTPCVSHLFIRVKIHQNCENMCPLSKIVYHKRTHKNIKKDLTALFFNVDDIR